MTMAAYALITNNHVVNVVEWDGETEYHPEGIDEITAISDLPNGVWIGWVRDENGDWSPPPPPAP